MSGPVLRSKDGDRSLPPGPRVVIGRRGNADIQLHDFETSRRHAEIVRLGSSYWIRDLGSTNGTFVNGQRVESALLRSGDRIQIGAETLTFINPEEERSALVQSAADTEAQEPVTILAAIDAAAVSVLGTGLAARPDREAFLQERLTIICKLSQSIGTIQTVDELLDRILDEIFRAFPAAERASVVLTGTERGQLVARASRGRADESASAGISRTIALKVIKERQAVLCQDAMMDQRFSAAASVAQLNMRSLMCVPLLAGDEILGVIHVDTSDPEKRFSEGDLDLLAAMAVQAAVYIQNAQLHQRSLRLERLAGVGETVAGLAHCVKNILNSIQAGAYVLDQGIQGRESEDVTKGWDIVKRNNKLMNELLMDLLTYSKERKPVRRPADLNEVCREICDMMAAKAQAAGAEIHCEPDADMPEIQVDSTGIQRCLSNLVTNAIDAMDKEQGLIVIATRWLPEGNLAEIRVADNGAGIPPDHQRQLFDLFFSTKGAKGTGLGLAVTRKIVEEHGGSIRLSSEVGQGAEFIISLPVTRRALEAQPS